MKQKTHDRLREEFSRLIREHNLQSAEVTVRATTLTPAEAIGNPEDRDYPLIAGKERMVQAEFRGHHGQAFTDMYGDLTVRLSDIVAGEPENNFRRAVFISGLNAVMSYLGMIEKTKHCRDEEPKDCSRELAEMIEKEFGNPKIAFAGFQPRMIEALSKRFAMRVTDLDRDNIGRVKFGIPIGGPEETEANLEWCDLALVTGTTVVNDTIDRFLNGKPVLFYGVTISGAAKLLGLRQVCYCGH